MTAAYLRAPSPAASYTGSRRWWCDGKTAFDSYAAADRQRTRNTRRFATDIEPYRCPNCHSWHVGLALSRRFRP